MSANQIRAAIGGSTGASDLIHYSLSRNGHIVPINNQDTVESSLTGSIKIDNLSPGGGYKLAISVGKKTDKVFIVNYYGNSSSFSISEGSNTDISMTLARAPAFNYLRYTGLASSSILVGDILYVLDGSNLLSIDKGNAVSLPVELKIDATVNSLALGKYFKTDAAGTTIADELWLNTSKGIYHRDATGSFVSNMGSDFKPNVNMSGAITIKDANGDVTRDQIFGLYSGGMKTLGMIVTSSQSDFTLNPDPDPESKSQSGWYTLDRGMIKYPDIKDFVSVVTTDLVGSISINASYDMYYVSTPLGALIGSLQLKKIADDADAFKKDPIGKLKDFWLKIGDGTKSIKLVSTAGNRVYATTNKGLYTSDVYTDGMNIGVPKSGLAIIPGTEESSFTSLKSFVLPNGAIATAAVTSDNFVMIIKNNAVSETLDSATGIPQNANTAFYVDNAGNLHIIVTGSNGVIDYQPSGF